MVKKLFVTLITQLVLIICAASRASAGELLKLPSGTVNARAIQKKYSALYAKSPRSTEWIIQFKHAVPSRIRTALKEHGVEVFSRIPEDAIVVRASYASLKDFAKESGDVYAIVPMLASYKIDASMGVTNIFNQSKNELILVKTFKGQESAQIAEQIRALTPEIRVREVDGREVAVVVPRILIPTVAAMTGVEHVQKLDSGLK